MDVLTKNFLDIRGLAVLFFLLFLPLLFYLLLNIMVVAEKILAFIEKILISIFGDIVVRIFRTIFAVLGAIIGVLRAIVDVFRPKKRSGRIQR